MYPQRSGFARGVLAVFCSCDGFSAIAGLRRNLQIWMRPFGVSLLRFTRSFPIGSRCSGRAESMDSPRTASMASTTGFASRFFTPLRATTWSINSFFRSSRTGVCSTGAEDEPAAVSAADVATSTFGDEGATRAVLCFDRGLVEGVRGFAMGPAFCFSVLVSPA